MFDFTILHNHIVTVRFTKKDGTERLMKCTTNMNLIPTEKISSGSSERIVNEDVKRVFDLEKNDWRSFRKDSVIDMKIED